MNSFEKNGKWVFLVPIDGSTNKNPITLNFEIIKNEENILNNKSSIKERENNEQIDAKELLNLIPNIDQNLNSKEKENDSKLNSYFILSKSKSITIADSRKQYISEFLKKNWKVRAKRIVLKLKKKYEKRAEKFNFVVNINNNNNSLINTYPNQIMDYNISNKYY